MIEENGGAMGVLIDRRRSHFPTLHEIGRLNAMALMLGRVSTASGSERGPINRPTQGATLATARGTDAAEIVRFLREHGARRQFYPAYSEEDFRDGATTRGFRIEDFIVARRDSKIAGVVGLWDQSSYKQTIVRGYAGWLGAIRPLYNFGAKWMGRPRLPSIGEEIRYAYAAFVRVADDDREIFQTLLRHAHGLAAQRGFSYLMIGMEERDPLLSVARRYPHINYPSRLFLACWDNGEKFYEQLDGRIPYAEIAAL